MNMREFFENKVLSVITTFICRLIVGCTIIGIWSFIECENMLKTLDGKYIRIYITIAVIVSILFPIDESIYAFKQKYYKLGYDEDYKKRCMEYDTEIFNIAEKKKRNEE